MKVTSTKFYAKIFVGLLTKIKVEDETLKYCIVDVTALLNFVHLALGQEVYVDR